MTTPKMDASRRLTYRFLLLPYHQQIKIAQDLGLLVDEDKGLADAELFARYFERAHDRNRLEQLWNSVEATHGVADAAPNPFAGR